MSGFGRRLQQGASIHVHTPATVPSAPAQPTITAGNTSVTVYWTAPVSDGGSPITSYAVTVSPGSETATVNNSTFSATVSGLANGTSYTATVTATNAVGSATSVASAAVTPGASAPAFPTAATTGITGVGMSASQLTASGSINVKTNNTTIQNLDISGYIRVYAGVTGTVIKNCRITTSGGTYCLDCKYTGAAGPVTIQDCQIISTPTTNTSACVNLSGGSSLLRCDISGSKQSVVGSLSSATITDNYMHDLVNVSGSAHCENIYSAGTSGGTLIQHNTLLNPLTQTACIFFDGKYGPYSDTTINDNLMAGGGYSVYGGSGATITNVSITNNVFSRTGQATQPYTAYWANGGYYGPKTGIDATHETYSGNTWADNGATA